MNYERIDITAKPPPKYNFNFTMNLDPNAKNYSNCDINGSFYEATEAKPIVAEKKVAADISGAAPPK
jgi:hypothetical protein